MRFCPLLNSQLRNASFDKLLVTAFKLSGAGLRVVFAHLVPRQVPREFVRQNFECR